MKFRPSIFTQALLLAFLAGCSTQKDRFLNREYHALNTKFNVLFNGNETLAIGKAVLLQNVEDDFLNLLPVEPLLLKGEDQEQQASIPSFSVAEEKAVKAIQKHSMNIGGQQRNRQIQEAYLLLGKARYYDRRFLPALEAFNFLLETYGSTAFYYEAKLWREKINMRLGNSALAIDNLRPVSQRVLFGEKHYAPIQATLAQAFLNLKQEDSARAYIARAALAEKNKATKARYRYIEGQLFERDNAIDSAQIAFQSIVNWKRKAPRIFWLQAKLQSIRLKAIQDSLSPLSSLEKMSRLFENQPYLHLIHQQQARYLLSQQQDSLALKYYNQSLQSPSTDTATKRSNYRELADYYFQAGEYVKTGAYLDSLLSHISTEGRLKKTIQRERESLDDVIVLEKAIRTTDSILTLVAMSKEDQRAFFQAELDRKRARELASIKEEKKGLFIFGKNNTNTFYFYNDRLLISGRQAFLSTWGNRPNRDNWKEVSKAEQFTENAVVTDENETTASTFFIETADFFIEQLPKEPHRLDSLAHVRRQAYLDVGILYKEKFSNTALALNRLSKLLLLSPNQAQEESALYHCFKLLEFKLPKKAQRYKSTLLRKFPNSPFAQILNNPEDYMLAKNQTPSSAYEKLYSAFKKQAYTTVLEEGENMKILFSGTALVSKIAVLQAKAIGRLQGEEAYKQAITDFLEKHPNADEAAYARQSLALLKAKGKQPAPTLKSYKWVFVFEDKDTVDTTVAQMQAVLEKDNNTQWKISRDVYSKETDFVVVHTKNQYPDMKFYLKQWQQIPEFEKEVNNFVLLSAQYEEIQRLKTWKPKRKMLDKNEKQRN